MPSAITRRLRSGLSSVHACWTTKKARSASPMKALSSKAGSWAVIAATPSGTPSEAIATGELPGSIAPRSPSGTPMGRVSS